MQPSTAPASAGDQRPSLAAPDPAAEALGAVLFRAHEAARHLENLLELEAAGDGYTAALHDRAKGLRKSIAVRLVDVAIEAVAIEVPAR